MRRRRSSLPLPSLHPSSFILHPFRGGILSVALSLSFISLHRSPGGGDSDGGCYLTTAPCGARTFLSPGRTRRPGQRPSGQPAAVSCYCTGGDLAAEEGSGARPQLDVRGKAAVRLDTPSRAVRI